ncbi:hypothetical protein CRUP_021573 [Coryphaenoides rupestris]|nr:hypothetical protein CRUP_021573 [Coryphaenoides rupestris]
MNRGDFFMTLRNQPVALSLYRQFCKLQEQETLKDLYNQDDDHQELANYYVSASYREKRLESRLSILQSALDEYNKAKNEFSAKATEEEMRLLRFQRKLDDEKGAGLLGLSLQPFVEVCMKRNNKYEAKKYVTKKGESDDVIVKCISSRLGDAPGISYSHIASKAYESGRTELAIKLLDYEARSGEQFCKLQEQETLKDLYNQDDDHQELANYYVSASYREKRLESRLSILQSALDEYNKAKNEFSAKATEEEMRLLRFQRKLDDEKGAGLLGLSLQPFVEVCMKRNNKYEAKKYVTKRLLLDKLQRALTTANRK